MDQELYENVVLAFLSVTLILCGVASMVKPESKGAVVGLSVGTVLMLLVLWLIPFINIAGYLVIGVFTIALFCGTLSVIIGKGNNREIGIATISMNLFLIAMLVMSVVFRFALW